MEKRVVCVFWKKRYENAIELFSNLKILCESYPEYNYNTLSNYLSKKKIPFENNEVHIERKIIQTVAINTRQISAVVNKKQLKSIDEKEEDLLFWLEQTPQERLRATTFIVHQSLKKDEKLNKSKLIKKKIHDVVS